MHSTAALLGSGMLNFKITFLIIGISFNMLRFFIGHKHKHSYFLFSERSNIDLF